MSPDILPTDDDFAHWAPPKKPAETCYADHCILDRDHEPAPHQAANGHQWGSVHPDVEYADEDEAGQLALGVPGEQRAIPTLATPVVWATDKEGHRLFQLISA